MMRDLSPEELKVVSGGQLESFSVSVDGFVLIFNPVDNTWLPSEKRATATDAGATVA